MIGTVVSRADEASTHIGERLLALADWTEHEDGTRPDAEGGGTVYRHDGFELREFETLHLHLEDAATAFPDPDLLVFVSRHAGETGPLLSAHFTGNLGPAEYGGADGELARAVLDLSGTAPDTHRTVVGFGGGHYAPRFERIARETDWAVGHVAADWGLDAMTDAGIDAERVIEQVFAESGADRAVIDGDRPDIEATIADLGYQVVSETWLREMTGVPLDIAGRLEDALSPVEDGLRFGERARRVEPGADVHPEIHTLPPDLLSDLQGIDADRAREAVATHSVAYETAENGNRVAGSIAVPDREAYDEFLDAACEILGDRYESVDRGDDELRVTERAFDPATARERGVPEGPAFGTLADGQPVEVDGETVGPDEVHETRRRTYRL